MDRTYHGQQPARRRALADGSSRANKTSQSQRQEHKHNSDGMSTSSKPLPHNESILPNGTLAVRHEQHTSEEKRHSGTATLQPRPRNSKRDSEISNASTNASNTNRRRKTHIGPWQLGRTIGRGGCSRVRLVRHSATGQYGAAKIISKATAEKVRALSLANLIQSAEHDASLQADDKVIPFGLEREICIMKLLDHPHIVRLYDIWENRDELYLIMEYVEGGELFSYIHEQGGLIEIHVVHIFRQIIAALIYCHRINIHHRDLKPENILLDRDTMTVKLVDFGMAALQPSGKKLTTPCGSPHYAAPEVIKTISYDGGKADVWSCGVILYVLLTGTPPFNYSGEDRHLKDLFRDIQMARYVMPDNLSPEAKDLIRKILVVNPKHRIGLDDIWHHPFLSKYQQELKFVGASATQDHWTGPLPSIAEWASLERTTIDREILRYLRTLWHSEKEEVIIQRLMSNEANQEKYFYSALRKYQNDQLENYQPSAHHTVAKSNSDYHHSARHQPTDDDVAELPTQKHTRSQSGYSILNNEHLYSKHSFYESPVSVASYDPFRASKQPMMPDQGCINQNVTVHRGQSKDSNRSKKRPTTALGHYQNTSSLRVQALRNNSKHSAVSGSSSYRSSPSHRRSGSIKRQSMSRLSLASSNWASSPPVVARPGRMGRRGVSFSRLRHRRPSAATASTVEDSPKIYSSDEGTPMNRPHTSIGSYGSSARSRSDRSSAVHRSKSRCSTSAETPRLRLRKPESPSKYIQSEARKVSTELGKAMEEAFNRASISSSIQTITTDRLQDFSQYDTPPTSFSNTRDSGGSFLATPTTKPSTVQRPLPPTPNETPNTFVHRKLAETRAEIARRLNEECDNAEHFNEVLENLDRLMLPPVNTKRVVSAPARSPEHPAPLHAIPEEKADASDRFGTAYDAKYRAVTDPLRPIGRRAVTATEQQTIRLVDQSPTRIAPLNIRKRSNASTESKTSSRVEGSSKTGPAQQHMPIRAFDDVHRELLAAQTTETAQTAQKKETVVKKKKSLWFRRSAEEKASEHEDKENQAKKKPSVDFPHIPEAWQRLDDRIKNATSLVNSAPGQPVKRSDDSEFPIRESNGPTAKSESAMRKGFLAFFGKKSKEDKNKRTMELGANFSTSSILSNFDLGLENSTDTIARTGPPEMQMNWLSRFLHIKPAAKTLCFRTGRGKVRQDLVRLLRDWQRFGVRDVVFNRESNVINARIDKMNHLKMKPVSFVIELFVVLEHGRRANLCLARFTQTRGAASSFSKVVDIVEDVCRARTMLIEDEEKKAAMMEVLD